MASSLSNLPSSSGSSAPELFLFGYDGGGLLKLALADGSTMAVHLLGRHVRVLLALNDALRMDSGLDPAVRGFRTNEDIAEAYDCGDPLVVPPSPQTIAAYRAQIKERIRNQTPSCCEAPKLFAVVRCVGVRLIEEILVTDLAERRRSDGDSPERSS